MELYLFRQDEFQLHYNCSFYSPDTIIPLARRRHPYHGCVLITLFTLFELLYVPCLLAIRRHFQQSCYKFMFFMGVVDMLTLPMNTLLSGLFAVEGAVGCTHLMLNFHASMYGSALWVVETSTAVLLALNRCVEMSSRDWAHFLYDGQRAWLWMIPPVLYGMWTYFYWKPAFFSTVLMAWSYDLHVGFFEDTEGYVCGLLGLH